MRRLILAAAAIALAACGDRAPEPPVKEAPSESVSAKPKRSVPRPAPWTAPKVARLYGHFPYAEAARETLRAGVCSGGGERQYLNADAAEALARMRAAAEAEGVTLNPSSCFRSHASQERLFTCVDAPHGAGCADGQLISAEVRATAVAPNSYSEHHTGYAIDFFPSAGDIDPATCPKANACTLTTAFAKARSGQWLAAHAGAYGFEMSFWQGSPQGVSYEPWHYRFVGAPDALSVFGDARTEFPPP